MRFLACLVLLGLAGCERPAMAPAPALSWWKGNLHTHSLWSTVLSDAHSAAGGLAIEGYEMLKALSGVDTHEHREWLPIVENVQDWEGQAGRLEDLLRAHPESHGFLIRKHGLYTWGRDLAEAGRHLEALEFLLEAMGRSESWRR